ncbi:hypothetical protein BJX96DRAFT_162230 [Aspergillus floccosus]
MDIFNRNPQPVCTLVFDNTGQNLCRVDPGGHQIPIFKVHFQKKEPHLIISRLPPPGTWSTAPLTVGTSRLHRSPSSKIDVSLHGHEILLKRDLLKSDNHHFDFPSLGHFKWKPDGWGGSSLKLYDNEQRLIAKCKGKTPQRGQIEIFVQGGDQLVDLVAVTGLAMQLFTMRENKEDDMFFDALEHDSHDPLDMHAISSSSSQRRRKFTRRSATGCRTCRNCTSTGRQCDGYDLSRLPAIKRKLLAIPLQTNLGVRLAWVPTSAERRCFSYFEHHSIPNLVAFFDSQLWQQLALQISHADPAVYHAANMLGALHEDSEENHMRLLGEDLDRPRHRFAVEQAARSYALLNRRRASQDPQLRKVVLLCCLIFVLSELLLGRYDSALQHLRSGLRILKEVQGFDRQSIDHCIVQTFQRLDIQSSHFGPGGPFLFAGDGLEELSDRDFLTVLWDLHEVRHRLNLLMNAGASFIAKCWLMTAAEIQARYGQLCQQQQRIISLYHRFRQQFDAFHRQSYHRVRYKEQRGMEIVRLQFMSQLVTIKTCLVRRPIPDTLTPEYVALLSAHETFLAKFPERPTLTMDYGIIPGLYTVATRCPRPHVRLRAINALRSWPHYEAIVNSNISAAVAQEALKVDLQMKGRQDIAPTGVTDEELTMFWDHTLASTPDVVNWSPIRTIENLQHWTKPKPENHGK